MLEVASMGLHVAHMTSRRLHAVTVNAAKLMGLDGYGLEPGCHADFVVLQARDPIEAIHLRAASAGRAPWQGDRREPGAEGTVAPGGPSRDHGFHTRRRVSLSISCGIVDFRTCRADGLFLPIFIHRR